MVTLIIADDHTVLREGLGELLEATGGHTVLAQAADGVEVLSLLKEHAPQILVMDISMPNLDGIDTLKKLSELPSAPPVLILSANEGESSVRAALNAGARGFVSKSASRAEIVEAIQAVINGKTYLSEAVTARLIKGEDGAIVDPVGVLSNRERQVLTYIAEGKTNRDIGKLLFISSRTVDTHRTNILKKLKVKTNAELTRVAINGGLVRV